MILAASSYNMGVFPFMEQFLHHLQGKNFQNRKVGIIENGTWAPSAGRCMREILEKMKNIGICPTVVTIRSKMNEQNKKEMQQLAEEMIGGDNNEI